MLQRSIGLMLAVFLGLALASEPSQANHTINILDPSTSYNREVTRLLIWVVAFAALVFVVVIGALTYTVVKFRRTGNEVGEPPQFHGNDRLEIIWTVIPTLIVLVIFAVTAQGMFNLSKVPAGAMKVEVKGYQFWWDFTYPELGVRNSNELILPVGKPVAFEIEGGDIIHSFWITSLVGKQDAIPGVKTEKWVTPEKEGNYYGQCTELCGASHANMRFRVKVVSQAEFDRFIAGAKAVQPVQVSADPVLAKGEELYNAQCAACHAVNGKPNAAQLKYPDLTFFGNRTTFGAGLWENKPDSELLVRWIQNSASVKPGSKMPAFANLSDDDAKAIAAYLHAHKVEGLDFSRLARY